MPASGAWQELLTDLRTQNLPHGVALAKHASEESPEDPRTWQLLGILQLAVADPAAAEASFESALERLRGTQPHSIGIEDVCVPGTPCYDELRRLKVRVAVSAGEAAVLNNLGAARLLLGERDGAARDFDEASRVSPDLAAPWINGALVAIGRGDASLAFDDLRHAANLGENGPLLHTTIAEAQLQLGRTDRAETEIRQALDLDATYPYALLLKSKLDLGQGRSRDSLRALTQALAAGPVVAVDSRLVPFTVDGSLLAGGAPESHLQLSEHAFSSRRGAFRLNVDVAQQYVEKRDTGNQYSGIAEITYSSKFGTIAVDGYAVHGGKPGSETPIADLTPHPDASFRLRQGRVLVLHGFRLGRASTLWLHANFRDASVSSRPDDATPFTTAVDDREWLGEARVDWVHGPKQTTQVGAAYGVLNRSGTGGRPLEPNDVVFPTGRSVVWSAYVLHRMRLHARASLTLGLLDGGAAGDETLQPLLDLALTPKALRTIHLRFTPRFNDSVSNLIPLDVVAKSAQRDVVDRSARSTVVVNRDPTLQSTKSKQRDFELAFDGGSSLRRKLEAVLFHRTVHDVNSQGADPRLATALVLTPLENGAATGVEGRATFLLKGPWSFRMFARYQQTDAEFVNTTYDQSSYPVLSPTGSQGMPNFPTYQGEFSIDFAQGRWNAHLVGIYAGRRPTAVSTTIGGASVTFLSEAPSQVTGHLLVSCQLSRAAGLTLDVYNLGSANFYPGYPGKTTAVLGFDYHF